MVGRLAWSLLEHRLAHCLRHPDGFHTECGCGRRGPAKDTRKAAVREHARHVARDALVPHVDQVLEDRQPPVGIAR